MLLVSEGIHEEAGALENLVRRVVEREITSCEYRIVKDSSFRLHRGKGPGNYKRAISWMLQARREGFDALVMVIDRDRDNRRILEFEDAQNEQLLTAGIRRSLGIAIRSFDAWMLADETALSVTLQCPIQRQPSPEENPDPKASCKSLRDSSPEEISLRDLYAKLGLCIDLQCLSDRCPKGFGVFAARLRSL
jgi:hypothetical protein